MFKVYEYAIETGSTLALLAERETYAGAIRSGWNAIEDFDSRFTCEFEIVETAFGMEARRTIEPGLAWGYGIRIEEVLEKEAPEFSFADIRAAFAEYEATVREIGAEGESFTLRSVTLDLSDILSERGKARIA